MTPSDVNLCVPLFAWVREGRTVVSLKMVLVMVGIAYVVFVLLLVGVFKAAKRSDEQSERYYRVTRSVHAPASIRGEEDTE